MTQQVVVAGARRLASIRSCYRRARNGWQIGITPPSITNVLHSDRHYHVGTEFPGVAKISLHARVAEGATGRTETRFFAQATRTVPQGDAVHRIVQRIADPARERSTGGEQNRSRISVR